MARKRSKMEIVYDILEALSEEPTTPTRLATVANLPYDRLQPLLAELESKGVVRTVENPSNPRSRTVYVTDKGLQLLAELRRLRRVLRDFGLTLI